MSKVGMIKHARPELNFAFITDDSGGPDVFVHGGTAAETGAKLQYGLYYAYDTRPNKKFPDKLEAYNLRPIREMEKARAANGNPPPVRMGQEMPE